MIGHNLRRNCLLKGVTEGELEGSIEVTGTQERSRKQPLDDRKEKRGCCELQEELDGFGRGYVSVIRLTA